MRMTKVPTTSPTTSSILRGKEVLSFLGEACKQSMPVQLRPNGSAESVVVCIMSSVDANGLVVHRASSSDSTNPLRKGTAVSGRFYFSGKILEFDTFCAEIGGDAARPEIVLHRPTFMEQRERRRTARRSFRQSSLVQMSFTLADVRNDVQGELLNISEGGMACRFAGADIEKLHRHTMVDLNFRLADESETLKLKGQAVSITPASEGLTIVGIEFSHDYATSAEFNLFRTQLNKLQKPNPENLS